MKSIRIEMHTEVIMYERLSVINRMLGFDN